MYKVQKHIMECQNEVKSNIFHEAFSLIHDTAFHHPHDDAHIEYKDEHDEHRNFTLTEEEILHFFNEHHDHHVKGIDDHTLTTHDDLLHTHDELLHAHGQHHSIDNHPHVIDEHSPHHHTLNEHLQHPHSFQTIAQHYPHANLHGLHRPHLANIHKKTDAAAQETDQLNAEQRVLDTITAKRSPYIYFDMNSDAAATNQQQQRRSDAYFHLDAGHHQHDIHPTTASFKDKRIAGVSTQTNKQTKKTHFCSKFRFFRQAGVFRKIALKLDFCSNILRKKGFDRISL